MMLLSGYSVGGRKEQVSIALALIKDWYSFLFGIGNATQRALASSFGTEVEPVYLFVNYGLVGFLLRYGLLLVIFTLSSRVVSRHSGTDRVLAIASVSSIIGYLVFSTGYFFFQELYVGLLPWIVYGWVVGRYFRKTYDKKLGLAL